MKAPLQFVRPNDGWSLAIDYVSGLTWVSYNRLVLDLGQSLDSTAAKNRFAGVVRVERRGSVEFESAYGLSDRRQDVANEPNTRFAIASGTKGLTALTLMSLIEQGMLELETTARSWLRDDLPLIHDSVTVGQLLAHRSGIGDYLDEETMSSVTEYLMTVPVQQLSSTERYLSVLEGHPMKFSPGERFSYSNSGYVVLALIAERCTGESFHDLVTKRVCERAGMQDTAFLRSDVLGAWRSAIWRKRGLGQMSSTFR